jgi:hypothetical protein
VDEVDLGCEFCELVAGVGSGRGARFVAVCRSPVLGVACSYDCLRLTWPGFRRWVPPPMLRRLVAHVGTRPPHAGCVRPSGRHGFVHGVHQQYQISGRIHVVMADGTEFDSGPGEITSLPPGHDAWVVGDEPVVAIDWQGASVWAREQAAGAS